MKKTALACVLFVLVCPVARPGVVIEMEVKDPSSTGEGPTDKIFAQGEMLRMDPHGEGGGGQMSMIFRDDTLWMVNHSKKTCQMIDKQGMEQLGGVMTEMQAQLAKLPPEQRAMMEKMMKGKMPGGMPGAGEQAPPRRLEVGATEQVGDYSCTLNTLYSGNEKVWEVCATEELPGATAEAMGAFDAMSRFAEQLRESLQLGALTTMIDTPFHDMDEVGGFPVRVRFEASVADS